MSESFASSKPFYDDKSFPYGFKRSGDFTIKEAELLVQHGHAFIALEQGDAPVTEQEERFIQVINGKADATSAYEKTWLKYKKLCRGRSFYGVSSKISPQVEKTSEARKLAGGSDSLEIAEDTEH